jgi:Phage terminase, small subunit
MASLDPPEFLNPAQRRIWTATTEQLLAAGTTARVTPDSLLAYVSAVASYRRATELLNRTDIIVERDGKPVANPALDVQRQAAPVIAAFEKHAGLGRRTEPAPMNTPAPIDRRGRWCETHRRYECTANRVRVHALCHAIAVVGIGRCKRHAGVDITTSPDHLLALQRRHNPIAGEPMDIGPAEALLWRVRVLSGEVARLDDLIAALEADELVWGKVRETEDEDGRRTEYGARLNAWLQLRAQRETALHAACEAALRANIEERLVRLAEQQGAMLRRVLVVVLGDFGVAADDPRIPEILPRRIRELTAS